MLIRLLIGAVVAVVAVILITLAIIASAPYIAIGIVLVFVGWLLWKMDDEPPEE